MKTFVIHRTNGDIIALVTCQPDAPPVAVLDNPDQVVTEILTKL
jgi:hypothetical protein